MRSVIDLSAAFDAKDSAQLLGLLKALGATILRSNREGILKRLCGDELSAPGRASIVELCDAVLRDGVPRTIEHRIPFSDGGEQWLRTALARAEGGELYAASLDITAERQNERQWREVESWLATLGESLPFEFWIWDRAGRIVLQNPASMKRIGPAIGLTPEELQLPPRESREQLATCFRRAFSGEAYREELSESGERVFIRIATQLRNERGVQGVLAVDLDVTELKRTEARLRDSLAELARTQDVLVRNRQLAALGEMAGAVAHEVRNPLGSISNVASLLRRTREVSELAQLSTILDDEVGRLDQLVHALLQFAEPRPPRMKQAPLGELLHQTLIEVLHSEDATRRITSSFEIDPNVPELPMDAELLALALTNLFRNAVQAMSTRGEVKVRVGKAALDGKSFVRVAISDTGNGLPADVKERLFEPFVTGKQTGTGLGLSIVRRVIEQHRGELDVESTAGAGTTFILSLPL